MMRTRNSSMLPVINNIPNADSRGGWRVCVMYLILNCHYTLKVLCW